MARIFINYRREDSSVVANIIYNSLLKIKGNTVFIDKKGIPVGFDFRSFIEEEITKYDLMLSIIGNQWMHLKDEANLPRIKNNEDTLRMELAVALRTKNLLVIPILIDNVIMPGKKDLPEDLDSFPDLNAVRFLSEDIETSLDSIKKEMARSLALRKHRAKDGELMTSKDLSSYFKVIDLQDSTCVIHGIVNAMQTNLLVNHSITAELNVTDLLKKTRKVDGLKGDDGSFFETAIFSAEFKGITVSKWVEKGKGKKKGLKPENVRLRSYRTDSMQEMIEHLNSNRPLLTGITVYGDELGSEQVAASGLVPQPDKNSPVSGGHAVIITHIDLITDQIKFANSWGKEWGDKGFGYFTRNVFKKYVNKHQVWAIEAYW